MLLLLTTTTIIIIIIIIRLLLFLLTRIISPLADLLLLDDRLEKYFEIIYQLISRPDSTHPDVIRFQD